ncbi:MAG: sialidase family protein, partial [Planctomycetota bacterium JB042]
ASPLLALLPLVAPFAGAQPVHVRAIQQLDTLSTGIGLNPSIANDGHRTVVSYFDNGTDHVFVSVSDGRGESWAGPVQVDTDATNANKISQVDACHVHGDDVYVLWKDERNGSSADDLWFRRSTDGGLSFTLPEVTLDDGYSGSGQVRTWRFATSPGGPQGDYLYALFAADANTSAPEELFLVYSTDGGTNWSNALLIGGDAQSGVDVDSLAICADGPVAHMIWDDDSSSIGSGNDSVYYRRIDVQAQTLSAITPLDVTDTLDAGDSQQATTYSFGIACEGDLVAAAWLEERTSTSNEELRVAISTDGGASFGPDAIVGGYAPGVDDVDFSDVLVTGGAVYVAYTDNRVSTGTLDDVYVSVLPNAISGGTFTEVGPISGAEGGSGVRLAGAGDVVGATWTSDLSGNQYAGGAFTQDGGATWTTDIRLSADDGSVDADIAEIGFNAAYGNFVHVWLSNDIGTNNVFASGYRPQTLVANGFVAGSTTVSFSFARFRPTGGNPNGVVFLAVSPGAGSFLLPDGRDLGLAVDALTVIGTTILPFLSSPIAVDGSGTTTSIPTNLPPGFTIHAVGMGFQTDANDAGVVTDVIPIEVP